MKRLKWWMANGVLVVLLGAMAATPRAWANPLCDCHTYVWLSGTDEDPNVTGPIQDLTLQACPHDETICELTRCCKLQTYSYNGEGEWFVRSMEPEVIVSVLSGPPVGTPGSILVKVSAPCKLMGPGSK